MMRRFALIAGLAIAAAALAAGATFRTRAPTRPYVQWVGHDSKMAHESVLLIRDEPSWLALWESHTGKPHGEGAIGRHAAPKIDFTQCAVVAFFRGPSTNEDGEILDSIQSEKDRVILRFESSGFQTFGLDGSGGAVKTTPYGIWVIPATDKPIVIEEGKRELKNEPLTWKEVKRFDAP